MSDEFDMTDEEFDELEKEIREALPEDKKKLFDNFVSNFCKNLDSLSDYAEIDCSRWGNLYY